MAQQNRISFRYATRQNVQKVGQIAFAANGGTPLELPRVGFLSRIILQFVGTITLSGAGSLTNLSPWNLLTRIKVNSNLNSFIWDTTGYGAYLEQNVLDRGYAPDKAGAGSVTVDPLIHAAPVASGANAWVITWIIPIGGNQGSNFEAGLINLQSPQVRVTVEPTFCPLTDVAALATAITGNLNVYYEYYELPDPARAMWPTLNLVRTIEEQMPVGGVGANIYTIPRQGTLLHLLHYMRLNNARSDSYDSAQIRFNFSSFPYQIDKGILRLRNRELLGVDLPTGVYLHDFWHAGEDVSAGDNRDVIDTEKLSTLESIINVSAGATLGAAGTNFFNTVRRIVQVFQQ